MFKIIKTDTGEFTYKEINEDGNSVRTGTEMFKTEEGAQLFVDEMTASNADSVDETVNVPAPDGSETLTPTSESAPANPDEVPSA